MTPATLTPPARTEPSHQTLEQAAEWYALLRSGEATDTDRTQWQAWIDDAAEHRQAWRFVERISHQFAPIQNSPNPRAAISALQTADGRALTRRQALRGVAAMAGTGALGWTLWRHTGLYDFTRAGLASHRSGTGQHSDLHLPDGTRVWLNSSSAFNEDYGTDLRRLQLIAGEMHIDTASDPARPLVVDTEHGRLRALGTRFTVRHEGEQTLIAVYGGAVEIRTAQAGVSTIVQAGEQTRFGGSAVQARAPADPAREAWTRGLLLAQSIPLSDVVRELRIYRRGHLSLAPEIAHLSVFGSYPAGDPDRALDMLESVLPIRVRRRFPWWVSIEARNPASPSS